MESDVYPIAVVDSCSISCEGLKSVLDRHRFQIAQVWRSLEDVLRSEPSTDSPAAILINAAATDLPSAETLEKLRAKHPEARLVLISERRDVARIQKAMLANFDGFLLESFQPKAFSKAIELILLGERVFPVIELGARPEEGERRSSPFKDLSERQMRVVSLLAKAYSNKEIARELEICESTVKVHVKAILRKTGSRNRTDAALLVRRMGVQNDHLGKSTEVPRKTQKKVTSGPGVDRSVRDLGADIVMLGSGNARN
ncbi:LuxR C-terminal-related transcriptional regulator [Tropicimonas sediminicola]|uniref:Two component transcriptional regulator, LuxR family n=1 Tax=Tropicimonas sediminicola TaxID=1031541 RepID=A0A239LGL2_9RHOB|nr:response regulator transcription factor [Tropicimonas sediminicola]SNT28654.1 two component transcriptional regulator, LuxR family [Tropicimonas sediminicola]